MGQYYKPIILTKTGKNIKAWMYSHEYGNGLKLMEHSWIGNEFVETFESLLIPGGGYHKSALVWAGDYADAEPNAKNKNDNLYHRCQRQLSKKINPSVTEVPAEFKYLVNHTKKEYVDKTKVKGTVYKWTAPESWTIHPLPLLTCEGNGRGGGDYHGVKNKLVGSWTRNVISVEKDIPEGYKEIKANFSKE